MTNDKFNGSALPESITVKGDFGNTIVLVFKDGDMPEVENAVLNNLMSSYEQRILNDT